ncbi:S-type pyocin domain-containing protein [Pseudomonas chengduensis]|nr:S-type pyocin domain-containing protein [Pseudomonas chengduensis]MDH1558792.1 S-type pyocin domain-containing protein [Pseudomonas chengduensis]
MSGYVPNNRNERTPPPTPPYNGDFDKQPARPLVLETTSKSSVPASASTKPLSSCVFAKPISLPPGQLDYEKVVPAELISSYGHAAIMTASVGAGTTAGELLLSRVAGQVASAGTWSLRGLTVATGSAAEGTLAGLSTMAAGVAVGVVGMLWPSPMGNSDLYTPEELAMQAANAGTAKTRVRFHIEQDASGVFRAYGFHTGARSGWDSVPVIEAVAEGEKAVAELGGGLSLVWTPQIDRSKILGTTTSSPIVQGLTDTIWIYPVTESADQALENPAYPPDYRDFIITFPAHPGVEPLYIVLSTQLEKNKAAGAAYEEEAYSDFEAEMEESAQQVTVKTRSGTRTRLDMIGRDADGNVSCVECKASETAPLTRNQRQGFPEIEQSGAVIVGKGKPGFPGGTEIPPTRVEISRPFPKINP